MKLHRAVALNAVTLAVLLLGPSHSSAADMIFKSRAACPGRPVTIPLSVVNVGHSGRLVAMDMAIAFSGPGLYAPDPNNAFTLVGYQPGLDLVVTGTTLLDPPLQYIAAIKGVDAFDTRANPDGSPAGCVGLIHLAVGAGVPVGTVFDAAPVASYPIRNGPGTEERAGATGTTVDGTPNGMLLSEPMRTLDTMAGAIPFASVAARATRPMRHALTVPLHKVAVGMPGDLNANGRIDTGDMIVLTMGLAGRRPLSMYQLITADVAPLNGYVPGVNPVGSGTNLNGGSYGDGQVTMEDLRLLVARLSHSPHAANFPACE